MQPSTDGDDLVAPAYVSERDQIGSSADLLAFTRRWRPLYEMSKCKQDTRSRRSCRYRRTARQYRLLLGSAYDADSVLTCLSALRMGEICEHSIRFSCVAMHLMAPVTLLEATLVAERFGVSTDIVLIQAHGGFKSLYEHGLL